MDLPPHPTAAAGGEAAAPPPWSPAHPQCPQQALTSCPDVQYRKAVAFTIASALVTGLPPLTSPSAPDSPPVQRLPLCAPLPAIPARPVHTLDLLVLAFRHMVAYTLALAGQTASGSSGSTPFTPPRLATGLRLQLQQEEAATVVDCEGVPPAAYMPSRRELGLLVESCVAAVCAAQAEGGGGQLPSTGLGGPPLTLQQGTAAAAAAGGGGGGGGGGLCRPAYFAPEPFPSSQAEYDRQQAAVQRPEGLLPPGLCARPAPSNPSSQTPPRRPRVREEIFLRLLTCLIRDLTSLFESADLLVDFESMLAKGTVPLQLPSGAPYSTAAFLREAPEARSPALCELFGKAQQRKLRELRSELAAGRGGHAGQGESPTHAQWLQPAQFQCPGPAQVLVLQLPVQPAAQAEQEAVAVAEGAGAGAVPSPPPPPPPPPPPAMIGACYAYEGGAELKDLGGTGASPEARQRKALTAAVLEAVFQPWGGVAGGEVEGVYAAIAAATPRVLYLDPGCLLGHAVREVEVAAAAPEAEAAALAPIRVGGGGGGGEVGEGEGEGEEVEIDPSESKERGRTPKTPVVVVEGGEEEEEEEAEEEEAEEGEVEEPVVAEPAAVDAVEALTASMGGVTLSTTTTTTTSTSTTSTTSTPPSQHLPSGAANAPPGLHPSVFAGACLASAVMARSLNRHSGSPPPTTSSEAASQHTDAFVPCADHLALLHAALQGLPDDAALLPHFFPAPPQPLQGQVQAEWQAKHRPQFSGGGHAWGRFQWTERGGRGGGGGGGGGRGGRGRGGGGRGGGRG